MYNRKLFDRSKTALATGVTSASKTILAARTILISICMALIVCLAVPVDSFALSLKPEYIAHRGLSAKAPENTIAAFELAAQDGRFYGVEFDIWEASSEPDEPPLLLVMHNKKTGNMCEQNVNIRTITRDTLDSFTITHGKGISKYPGQKIPTVEQALDAIYKYPGGPVPVIELKHRLSPQALEYLITYIGDRPAVVISFYFEAVADTARLTASMGKTNITTMYLREKLSKSKYSSLIRKMKKAGIGCLSLNYKQIKKNTVKKFHKAGLKVCVWTVPSKKAAKKLKKKKVDYITANKYL